MILIIKFYIAIGLGVAVSNTIAMTKDDVLEYIRYSKHMTIALVCFVIDVLLVFFWLPVTISMLKDHYNNI